MTFPSLPSPATWSAGEVVTAPALRADVSDAVALLSGVPMFIGQQQLTGQQVNNNTLTPVQLDTELYDNWNGHEVGAFNTQYWGMFAGWYLCETTIPLASTASGTGSLGAMIAGVQNNGALTQYGGVRMPVNSVHTWQAVAAKLMMFLQVGTFAGASNDYVQSVLQQDNGSSSIEPLFNSTNTAPTLTCRWVCAASGTEPLSVPANPAWPTPPTVLGHTFMNANVRDAIRFLTFPPIMEAYHSTGTGSVTSSSSLPTVGLTTVMDTEIVDNYNAYNNSTGTWTAPVSGVYYAYVCESYTTGANANVVGAGLTVTSANYNGGTQITLWGGMYAALVSQVSSAMVRKKLRLNAGDTVQAAAVQNDSSAATITYAPPLFAPRFIMVWIGA